MSHHAADRELQELRTVLSSRAVIRLVTEIDDHGPIPHRQLACVLTDLSTHHIRQATEQAGGLGLLDRSPAGLGLTGAGRDLADLYDATARWARRHNYPVPICDFASRIRHSFELLAGADPASASRTEGAAVDGLDQLHRLLTDWIRTHPSTLGAHEVAA